MYSFKDLSLMPETILRHKACALMRFEGGDTPDILLLQGSPYERGYAHGLLLADRIAHLCAHMLTLMFALTGGYSGDDRKPPLPEQIARGKQKMLEGIEQKLLPAIRRECPEFFDELQGIADGARTKYPDLGYDDLLIINTTPESVEIAHGCSSVIAYSGATGSGKMLHGINMDYGSFGAYHRGVTVCAVRPDGGNAYIGACYAGAMFPMSFLNEHGISYGEMTSRSTESAWPQIPHWIQAKLYAERAKTLDDAIETGRRTGGTTGFINFLCQEHNRLQEAISIETAGRLTAVRRPGEDRLKKPDLMFTTNFFGKFTPPSEPDSLIFGQAESFAGRNPAFADKKQALMDVQTLDEWIELNACPRYKVYESRLPEMYGKIDVQNLIELLSTYPISRGGENLPPLHVFCERAPMPYGLPDMPLTTRDLASVYSMVTEPGSGTMHIAAGLEPAQAGRYLKITLEQCMNELNKLA